MGGGIVTRLLACDYSVHVHVHDIDASKCHFYEQKGAVAQQNNAQAATKCIVSIICVVDAAQTEQVLFGTHGVVTAAPAGHTVMLCPTIAPQDVERFAVRLAELPGWPKRTIACC